MSGDERSNQVRSNSLRGYTDWNLTVHNKMRKFLHGGLRHMSVHGMLIQYVEVAGRCQQRERRHLPFLDCTPARYLITFGSLHVMGIETPSRWVR